MKRFSQLINRFFTASPQPEYRKEIAALQEVYRQLRLDMEVLERNNEEHAKKTSRSLESYRARSQPRKDGRFGSEEPDTPTNSGSLGKDPTHEEIERMARSQALIR